MSTNGGSHPEEKHMIRTKRARASAIVAAGVAASSLGITALAGGTAGEAVGASAAIAGGCTGVNQGAITSDVTVAGQKGAWPVSHLSDGIVTPYDPSTGQVTGRHQEQGIKISVAAGPETIGLLNAQLNNETLSNCSFVFYRPTSTGALQAYYKVSLTGVKVVNYAMDASPTSGTSTNWGLIPQGIQRTWLPTNKSASDTWVFTG